MRAKTLLSLFLISVMAPPSMLWGQNTYVSDNNFEQALTSALPWQDAERQWLSPAAVK